MGGGEPSTQGAQRHKASDMNEKVARSHSYKSQSGEGAPAILTMPERWLERITMSTPRTNHAQKMEMNVQTHREKMTRVFATRSDSKPVRLFSTASARSARHCGAFKSLGRHACAPFLTQNGASICRLMSCSYKLQQSTLQRTISFPHLYFFLL